MMSRIGLAEAFAAKAKANAGFVLVAIKELGPKAYKGNFGLYIANQLVMEGIELALKAFILSRGNKPTGRHILTLLYRELDDADRSLVDETVRNAVLKSATGPLPFGLPNTASVTLVNPDALGQEDPLAGYQDMDAKGFFLLLDEVWKSDNSQYLGTNVQFEPIGVLRTDSRLLAGGILACIQLAEGLGSRFTRSSTWTGASLHHPSPTTNSSEDAAGAAGRSLSQENSVAMTVIDYVDGVQVLDPENFGLLWHRECAVEMEIIRGGAILLQPATDADAYKCFGCGKPIPIIKRNMPGYFPGYDRSGEERDHPGSSE